VVGVAADEVAATGAASELLEVVAVAASATELLGDSSAVIVTVMVSCRVEVIRLEVLQVVSAAEATSLTVVYMEAGPVPVGPTTPEPVP